MTTTTVSPFHTLEQITEELGTKPLNVLRLAARGHLKAEYRADGKIRATSNAISNYILTGSPDFAMPGLHPNDSNKFAPDHNDGFAHRFKISLMDLMKQIAEDQFEEVPRDERERPRLRIDLGRNAEVVKFLNAEAIKSFVRFKGETRPEPPKNRSIQYAVATVRDLGVSKAASEVNAKAIISGGGTLQKLYADPGTYKRLTDAAWEQFLGSSVANIQKHYPGHNGKPITVRFSVGGRSLPVQKSEVLKLAF